MACRGSLRHARQLGGPLRGHGLITAGAVSAHEAIALQATHPRQEMMKAIPECPLRSQQVFERLLRLFEPEMDLTEHAEQIAAEWIVVTNGPTDLASNVPYLAALSRPASGNRFDLQLFDTPAYTLLGYYLIGFERFANPIPLGLVGFRQPCSLMINPVLTTSNAPAPTGVIPPLSLQIPASSNALGLKLFVQGATLGPTALDSLALSNTVRGLVGLP